MNTLTFLRTTVALALAALVFSCSKDDDNMEPKTGYFAKTIKLTDENGSLIEDITLEYDPHNRLIKETFEKEYGNRTILTYDYNEKGQITAYRQDGDLLYRFVYEDNIMTKRLKYNTGTGSILEELPVSFSNGIYTMDDRDICKTDNQTQLLELSGAQPVFLSYGTENGIHANLTLSPTRYLIDEFRGTNIYLYDLILSNKEFKGFAFENDNFFIENTRNEKGLISKAVGARESSGEVELIWHIEYEERNLLSGQ